MHQSIDTTATPTRSSSDAVIRQSILRSIARDLMLPVDHPAVSGMMNALGLVSLERNTLVVGSGPVGVEPADLERVSLDTWCCVFAQAHASNAGRSPLRVPASAAA